MKGSSLFACTSPLASDPDMVYNRDIGKHPKGERNMLPDSRDVARAAMQLAMTANREEESAQKQRLSAQHIQSAASDFGGDFVSSVMKIIERAVVIAKREGLISEKFHEEGAVAGAAHDAVIQLSDKAMGLNVGGKIGVDR